MRIIENGGPRWLSTNPDRAWGERFFLLYIPIWVTMMSVWTTVLGGGSRGDAATLLFGVVIASPLFLVPAAMAPRRGRRWYESYWLKANLFVFIVNFSGNYFVSEYFFDVLGMIYHYPNLELTADAALLGSGEQSVPVLMYFITQATYMTYHTTSIVLMRRVLSAGVPLPLVAFVVLCCLLSYGWAWMETMSFANPALEGNFRYQDKGAMLAYGSIVFGMMLLPSFPIFYFLEEWTDRPWSLWQVAAGGASAAILGLFLTDLCTHVIGTL